MKNSLKLILTSLLVATGAGAQSIELGHATDTTITRGAATVLDIEGVSVVGGAEATVASATTTDLGALKSTLVSITGTTTITGFGTVAAGTRRSGRFTGALTLTHNATSLILPGGANITTAAGDRFEAWSLGSGNWVVSDYTKANGESVVGSAGLVVRPRTYSLYRSVLPTTGTTWLTEGLLSWTIATGSTPSRVAYTTTELEHINYVSTAGSGDDNGLGATQFQGVFNLIDSFSAVAGPAETANVRTWIGMSSSFNTIIAADDPVASHFGFRASSGASDTNWQAVTNDGTGGGTITDTGVAISTSALAWFFIENLGSSVKFYINGNLVATHTTNLPSGTANASIHLCQENLAASARNLKILGCEVQVSNSSF